MKDPANPQNEGGVFLYRFGRKIFDKIMEAMQPEFEDETPINPFDFWQGANFKLKLKKVAGYWNYDSSEFAAPSALLDDDDELWSNLEEGVLTGEIVAPDKFKDYDTLQKRLDSVLGVGKLPRLVPKKISTLRVQTLSNPQVMKKFFVVLKRAPRQHERLNLPPLLMRKTR